MQQRLLVLVDDDVDANDAREMLWAMGTRTDPASGARISSIETDWVFNPMLNFRVETGKPTYPFSCLIV